MHDIVSSKKMENGIVVFWDDSGGKKFESFNYSELIDMKINALDLLERPAEPRQRLRCDADAGVGDDKLDRIAEHPAAHHHLAAVGGEFDGVGQQVV